jgi:hypothetical protein
MPQQSNRRPTLTADDQELIADLLEDYAHTRDQLSDSDPADSENHESEARRARVLIEKITGKRVPALEAERLEASFERMFGSS